MLNHRLSELIAWPSNPTTSSSVRFQAENVLSAA